MVDPGVVHQDCQVTPPHKRTLRQIQVSTTNALEKLDLDEILSTKRVIVLLDYDGTLSPIVQDPSKAVLPSHVRDTLIELSKLLTVGIVSGRGLEKLKSFVNIPDLMYAGSHGFDIWIPDAEEQHYQVASDYLPKLAALRDRLTDKLSVFRGARVEDNIFSVTVHYRECTDEEVPKVREVVEAAKADYPDIRFSTGKKVFELKPNIVWNKGCAMLYILRSLGLLQRDDTYIIYVGDDVTDEDAFQVFHEDPCPQGVGIVVSDEDKDTGATYSLRSPDEVATFLTRLIEVQRRIGGPAQA